MNKQFLIVILNISNAINSNKEDELKAQIEKLNEMNLTDDQKIQVKDIIFNCKNAELGKILVEKSNVTEYKEGYCAYLDVLNNTSNDISKYKEYISKDYKFDDENDQYKFLSVLTRNIIGVGNTELIKLALEKLNAMK